MIYANIHVEDGKKNSIFGCKDSTDLAYLYILLRNKFRAHGIEINTPDVNSGRSTAFDLYFEGQYIANRHCPNFLLALENPNINSLNANPAYLENFTIVFSWNKNISHLSNVTEMLIPHHLHCTIPFAGYDERSIFSCLINGNKAFKKYNPNDLYQERIKTIRWYESNQLDKFELYGLGWDKDTPAFDTIGKIKRAGSRIKTQLFGVKPFPSYISAPEKKSDVLAKAKFSYCYENSKNQPNYITEKLFDSIVNGCIPIYWGADNVTEYIPHECFIDRRNFENTAAVHQYLESITPDQFRVMQSKMRSFLESAQAQPFSNEYYVSSVVHNILKSI